MKLKFESDLAYQLEAIEAVCGLFRGQELCRSEFTVVGPLAAGTMSFGYQSDLGIGNRLGLLDEDLLANLHAIQARSQIPLSPALASRDFTVEMETGTGKTYVYLRTAFELNRRYGFTKFVIVVPSVAIREGVSKSIEMMSDHFGALYARTPFEAFVYDSSRLGEVRNFATSATMQFMIVTVGAINKKDTNNLYKDSDTISGDAPIDLIRATRSVLIVDEPQSVDGEFSRRGKGKAKGKQALDDMSALCTLRYSATHANEHHMVYRLDAIDAYQKKLVKQIEVASATVENAFNTPFVRFESVETTGGSLRARVVLDVANATGAVSRREVRVGSGDRLEQTTRRTVYEGMRVGEISRGRGGARMEIERRGEPILLRPGEAHGDVDVNAVNREMIRRTIREHLEKELRLRPRGIKVLSLFFIDRVDKYRRYESGEVVKGVYAETFEREYEIAVKRPEFRSLLGGVDVSRSAADVHDGYFSIDKKGSWQDIELDAAGEEIVENEGSRAAAARAYNLIMRDKERLLDLAEPLRFIFSHSALREGWDNPNVFQICTLREMRTERQRRQTIGRGLRLCVNDRGERDRSESANILTVIANESYREFADKLQHEIQAETGIQFGMVSANLFASLPVPASDGSTVPLGEQRSAVLHEHLRQHGLIATDGRIQDALRIALNSGSLVLPTEFAQQRSEIVALLKKAARGIEIHDREERVAVEARQEMYESPEFRALWDRICRQTRYRVKFESEALVKQCTKALMEAPAIPRTQLHWEKVEVELTARGVETAEIRGASSVALDVDALPLPDLLTAMQERTQLKRATIYRIVIESGRLPEFDHNPQRFIETATTAINAAKQSLIADSAWSQIRSETDRYDARRLLDEAPVAYSSRMVSEAPHSFYGRVPCDSDNERTFVHDLEMSSTVKMYLKLPPWFKIPTPIGTYNPDWAMVVTTEDGTRSYLVVETKGGDLIHELRPEEAAKIRYGQAHFKALAVGEPPVARYRVAHTADGALAE